MKQNKNRATPQSIDINLIRFREKCEPEISHTITNMSQVSTKQNHKQH